MVLTFGHFEVEPGIAESAAACLNRKRVDWQRTVTSGVEPLTLFVVDCDQTREPGSPEFTGLQREQQLVARVDVEREFVNLCRLREATIDCYRRFQWTAYGFLNFGVLADGKRQRQRW